MKIIATIYRSDGNETVGDMWTETKSFSSHQSIDDIIAWVEKQANFRTARLTITPDQAEEANQ